MSKRSSDIYINLSNDDAAIGERLKKYRKIIPKPSFGSSSDRVVIHSVDIDDQTTMDQVIILDGEIINYSSQENNPPDWEDEIVMLNFILDQQELSEEQHEKRKQLFSSTDELINDFHHDDKGDEIIRNIIIPTDEELELFAEELISDYCKMKSQELFDIILNENNLLD